MDSFEYTAQPARVIFGAGALSNLRDEVERLGGTRVLILAGHHSAAVADRAAELLGTLAVARFLEVTMHTPVEVTDRAADVVRANSVDFLVSIGGGSATNLGKALAARTGLRQIAVPTTYAGSEVTPMLGETADGVKTTRRDPALIPQTVLYDVELTVGLPAGLSVASGLNAMAHAVEALYSPQANPIVDGYAAEAITRLARSLPRIVDQPGDLDARSDALVGGWLGGMCLAGVHMGLHHRLSHVLGGSYGLPHAETHAVLLPHVMAYNASGAPAAMARIAKALGVSDAPTGVYDLAARLGAPTSLAALGLDEAYVPQAAAQVTTKPSANPRELTADGVVAMLYEAWRGERPKPAIDRPDISWLAEEVVATFAKSPNRRVGALLSDLVRRLHGFVADNDLTEAEWLFAIDFLTRTGQMSDDKRQEFVLLSDTLGVSSAVDLLTNSRSPETTPSAVLGPFYVPGPPPMEAGSDISKGLHGTPLWADVRITDLDDNPVAGAIVDVWQSNEDGFYDVQLPDLEGPVLRARMHTDEEGRLYFWSILPKDYPIPTDGPVGEMLKVTGRHAYRAPHLHFMIQAPGFHRLVTQLFVKGGPYLDSDAVFGVKEELIVDFPEQTGPTPDGRDVGGSWRRVDFTFRIALE
jgi:maleylacetate reductase